MGKFMGASGLGQFHGAEFKNHWYTTVGWGFQPHFHDLKSCSYERDQHVILKQKAGNILVSKNALCHFVLLCNYRTI